MGSPPFIPKLNDDQTNNFDAEFTEMPIYSMDNSSSRSSRYHREKRKYLLRFPSFTDVRDETILPPEQDSDSEKEEKEVTVDDSTSDSDSEQTESTEEEGKQPQEV